MRHRFFTVVVALAILAVGGAAYGQGGTTSTLSGVVVDSGGGVVPGADVSIKHLGTGITTTAVTNAEGAFSFPGLNVGTYSVTVTLQGFKTVVINDVVLTSGAPANVRAVLEIGTLEEQIVVSSASEIVQTQSTTISSTINTNQIVKLPLTSRSAMDFVTFMPGVSTPGGNRQSSINGLPQGMINITLDGVNIQDNTLRSTDGFFAIVSPRLDAVEEVTVTTATQGAEAAQGAVQIKFVTRSGTNSFSGSGYHYYRSDKLNANTWFNNRDGVDKAPLKQNQYGGRAGGPIVIPGLFDGRNKAFFFVNYEEFRQPGATTRNNRIVLNPQAQQGTFSYTASGGAVQQVNVLALAAANGHLSTLDPTTAALLNEIRSAVASGSLATIDGNLQRFTFNVPTETLNRYPTFKIDYNITNSHRFSSALNYQRFNSYPDTLNNQEYSFPGFPVAAGQSSERLGFSNSLRSTLTQNVVNEARVGYSGAPVTFFKELNTGMFGGSSVNQGGFRLTFPSVNTNLTSPSAAPSPQSRNANSLLIEDTVTWLRGNHSFSMGGSWTQYDLWAKNSTLVPRLTFGVVTGDPALGMFTTANFPGASNANLTAAANLYALLVGRVSGVDGDVRLNEDTGQYEYLAVGTQRARMRETGFFFQDSWRMRPNLTINAGLRYELQFPFQPQNSSYSTATMADLCGISGVAGDGGCNLFQAGVTPGKHPEFINFGKGSPAYDTDYDNFAPSVGVAWTFSGPSGLLRAITGEDMVFRGGYTRAFNRSGMNDFSGQYNANPGVVLTSAPDRSITLGNLNNDGLGLPVLLRQPTRLGPGPFPSTPAYPLTDVATEDINLFDPNIQVPWADSWTVGLQRSVGRDMAVEARYVGTRSRDTWQVLNYNEVNIFDNGFINEFRQAQANLQAHVAAGCGGAGNACSFAYRGPGTGTAPLPTFLAYFNGLGASQAGNSALYTGSNWTNSTFQAFLAARNPNPFGMVYNTTNNTGTGITNNATLRQNARNAGLAANFFMANPDLIGGADLTTNNGRSDYNGLQLELRRRLSQGLQFQTSYAFGKATQSRFETFRRPNLKVRDVGSPGDLTHAFKANVVYDLPFGQGRRFGGNAGAVLDRVIGGWTVGLTSRIQSGQLIDLGNVRLVGMTAEDVKGFFKLRFDDAGRKVYMMPADVIAETIKAFSVSATSASGYGTQGAPSGRYFAPANGPDCIEIDNGADYGDCAVRSLVVTGPMFSQHDISIAKRIALVGRTNFEFRVEMLNAFNHANFVPVNGIGNNPENYEVTGLTGTNTARTIQLVSRINW
jgi:hypothetical protein